MTDDDRRETFIERGAETNSFLLPGDRVRIGGVDEGQGFPSNTQKGFFASRPARSAASRVG